VCFKTIVLVEFRHYFQIKGGLTMPKNMKTMDGNTAAAWASYAFTEVTAIYPITPSSTMAEIVDDWSANGKKNIFGQTVKVVEMQSEAGAAGAVHGSLQAGALTTTYTASQGLLLMIPNLYKMAGELLPGVLHVSARAIAAHALSIFGDHQDVMACRQTGVALLASSTVQEVMDIGSVAHLASIESRVPFIHFFDGFRTSHEIQKIEAIDYNDLAKLVNHDAIKAFRERSINPEHPVVRGTAQNPDIYFQGREASNKFYDRVPEIVEEYLDKIGKVTGRSYNLFDYYGAPAAENVIVAMGSICDVIDETIDYLTAKGEKVGCVKVHLYRPFSAKHFLNAMPKTVKKITVLDRTKEPGSIREPLFLDIVNIFYNQTVKPVILGGRYGLGSKDTTPSHMLAVFNNMKSTMPKDNFTVAINDDVTHLSLPEEESIETSPEGTKNCKFWGLGSDGTVGANKSAIKIIGDKTDLYAQGYFSYDSKKSGGATVSHLRFGNKPIKSPYLINNADYIACHNSSYVYQYNLLKGLKKGGTFVLNSPWNEAELEKHLPVKLKNYIAKNNINFYIIDAVKIAGEIGLGGRINMIMQSAFFKLANVIKVEDAVKYLKESIEKSYGKKGQNIVDMNWIAVDKGQTDLVKVNVPASWNNSMDEAEAAADKNEPDFIANILRPMNALEGDNLPVSAFNGVEDGTFPVGTSAFEKRRIAVNVPEWKIENCIQCNQCSVVCPHATVRPILLNADEKSSAPTTFETKLAIGKGLENHEYRIQVSPYDCTGCGNCAQICPAKEKALVMMPVQEQCELQTDNWNYAMKVSTKADLFGKGTIKGSQFEQPLMEFSGACAGCGETAYIKLITQLFGDRMMVANATGCTSIWGASAPSIPYTANACGQGPAWANSLFEDNAEFGLGMYTAVEQLREKLASLMNEAMNTVSPELKAAFVDWLKAKDSAEGSKASSAKILALAPKETSNKAVAEILEKKDFLVKKSQWIFGGDGWAYDIGFGGVDHVLASGEDVNIFVVDTEVYSNTGGQSSKSTPTAAVAKFAASGKKIRKKDLGMIAMSYGYVYVAQIALGSNMNQTLKAIAEAEAYKGPSLIIAYAPCINHGIKSGMGTTVAEEKKAVDTGYWHLYRFNPDLSEEGKNPFVLDSKEPTGSFMDFIKGEIRYTSLINTFPEIAEDMFKAAEKDSKERYESYKRMAAMQF
jgi:pyruvate-ferredoxin/flavodoxin oxidoreductase